MTIEAKNKNGKWKRTSKNSIRNSVRKTLTLPPKHYILCLEQFFYFGDFKTKIRMVYEEHGVKFYSNEITSSISVELFKNHKKEKKYILRTHNGLKYKLENRNYYKPIKIRKEGVKINCT